jgi:hypothetical protein
MSAFDGGFNRSMQHIHRTSRLASCSCDLIADETPIAQLARGPMIIAMNPKVPAKTLQEFVALAKKEPGKLSYASAGNGSITHIVTEYFLDTAGTDVVHVPYKELHPHSPIRFRAPRSSSSGQWARRCLSSNPASCGLWRSRLPHAFLRCLTRRRWLNPAMPHGV